MFTTERSLYRAMTPRPVMTASAWVGVFIVITAIVGFSTAMALNAVGRIQTVADSSTPLAAFQAQAGIRGNLASVDRPANASASHMQVLGVATMSLLGTIPLDEADNLRWSLVRRTPAAATVYTPQSGVAWDILRRIEAEGDIFLPADFIWSFNETFRDGPGYKKASGILAGGHCALATAFNAAARAAGLPSQYKPHRTPFSGYAPEQSVNILWGRDDLTVKNALGSDLCFHWRLSREAVTIQIVSATGEYTRPALPSLENATIAMTYGRPRNQRWGTLGRTFIVDHSIYVASQFADRVNAWNGEKPVVIAVNPNVVMGGENELDALYVYHLIAEAERRQIYVMLDVQTGNRDPLQIFNKLMDRYMRENVWFDWDLEHSAGGRVDAAQINAVASAYFRRRVEKGYRQKGIFAFYIFNLSAVQDVKEVQRTYEWGWVAPIFDGYGSRNQKLAKTEEFRRLFVDWPYGIMEFESRWGSKYDGITAQDYFAAYPDALIFASQ